MAEEKASGQNRMDAVRYDSNPTGAIVRNIIRENHVWN
jgi:hypothetical protein